MNDKIIVKKILSDTEYVVYLEDLRTNLLMKQISGDEDLSRWVNLCSHTNIVSLFDVFDHQEADDTYRFSLQEMP